MKTMNRREFLRDGLIGVASLRLSGCEQLQKDTSKQKAKSLNDLINEAAEYHNKIEGASLPMYEDEKGISKIDFEKHNHNLEIGVEKWSTAVNKAEELINNEKDPEKKAEYAKELPRCYYNIGTLIQKKHIIPHDERIKDNRRVIEFTEKALDYIDRFNARRDLKARSHLRAAINYSKVIANKQDLNNMVGHYFKAFIEGVRTDNKAVINISVRDMENFIEGVHPGITAAIRNEMSKDYFNINLPILRQYCERNLQDGFINKLPKTIKGYLGVR